MKREGFAQGLLLLGKGRKYAEERRNVFNMK